MTDLDLAPTLDPDDAMEARLRLGVLTSALIERADCLCTDVTLMRLPAAPEVLKAYLADATTLAAAMEVLVRRATAPTIPVTSAPRS
ncbi:MAG: hypothetical protein ACK4FG_04795 [Brevundimonas sp.]